MTSHQPANATASHLTADSNPEEQAYLDLLTHILEKGEERQDRTGTGTRAIFGAMLTFDLGEGRLPVQTTRHIPWRSAIIELLWFISGDTNIRRLLEQGVHIWTPWAQRRYEQARQEPIDRKAFEQKILDDPEFARRWGDLGPIYGHQWRFWQGPDGQRYDQLQTVIDQIRHDPKSRRILFHSWNVTDLAAMALPPCHLLYQYQVTTDGRLNGILYQRSADAPLGLSWNILEASLLIHMIARITGLRPGRLAWMGGDIHIYNNQADAVRVVTSRTPRPWPTLSIDGEQRGIDQFRPQDFTLHEYHPWPTVNIPVSV